MMHQQQNVIIKRRLNESRLNKKEKVVFVFEYKTVMLYLKKTNHLGLEQLKRE